MQTPPTQPPATQAPAEPSAPRALTEATLETCRRRLLDERHRAVKQFLDTEGALHELVGDREVEIMDRVQGEVWEQMVRSLDERDREELEEVQAALDRIADGTYGRCQDCDQPIASARLEALPTARRCMACQDQQEAVD